MKRITLVLFVCLAVVFAGCNKNDDNIVGGSSTTEAIIGSWKLVAELTDGTERSLTDCEKEELYIFGTEQLTHEVYSTSSDETDDESDDEGDDESDDISSDDEDSDDESDEESDEDSDDDDDDDKAASCMLLTRKLAYWSNEGASVYKLTYTDVTESHNVTFTESNNKFYFEKTVTERGVTKVKRYVFQRQ